MVSGSTFSVFFNYQYPDVSQHHLIITTSFDGCDNCLILILIIVTLDYYNCKCAIKL